MIKNKITIEGSIASITIIRNGVEHTVIVDAKDAAAICEWDSMYFKDNKMYSVLYKKDGSIRGKTEYVSRVVMGMPSGIVDHVDGNVLDNRRINLRVVDKSINALGSRKLRKDNISGVTGVSWNTKTNKWKAQIMVNGKFMYLGCFPSIEEASLVVSNFKNSL